MNTRTTIATALLTITTSLAATAGSRTQATADAAAAPSTTSTVSPSTSNNERPTEVVDELVRIGHGQMHIRCVGAGPTTVLLISGWGDGGTNWGAIEPAIAERARVCSYARFGTGTSDAPSTIQTFTTQADNSASCSKRRASRAPTSCSVTPSAAPKQ